MTRLALLSDIHYQARTRDPLIPRLESIVETFNTQISPDQVVVLGDIIHETTTAATDREHAATVRETLAGLTAPVRYLPGNHDTKHLSVREDWPRLFDHDAWTIDTDASLVFLDSTAPHLQGGQGEVSTEQRQALRDSLPALSNALVFSHHPLYDVDVSENRWFQDRPIEATCKNYDRVRTQLADAGTVAATFNGHLHEPWHRRQDGLDHFTVDAFNNQLEPSSSSGSFAVVDRRDTLQVRLYRGDGTVTHSVKRQLKPSPSDDG
ncbi:metallophosphoesterase [Halobacterium sp. R2-5]|uniref:metallophosphoesterase family protein n=1 Tax=Halobacterium sp. R2-5 TaxID=2715751 RepID=UPI001422F021|nr:metallophosphoesterase [Halobacterium sp. R2-5]NIC00903.1 hypothetical protein [Halobacterium sp. R2-5]